jgi:hypothetical protein
MYISNYIKNLNFHFYGDRYHLKVQGKDEKKKKHTEGFRFGQPSWAMRMVVDAFIPATWEAEAGGAHILGQVGQLIETCLKKEKYLSSMYMVWV